MDQRVLSVQSHVVSGYVGNKAATFPLQLLGWDVDPLLTVEFSNHVGYGVFGGTKFDEAHFASVIDALDKNGLLNQPYLLTGYTPGAAGVRVVQSLVDKMKKHNPNLVYVLDPVLGDDGRTYVSPDVIPLYKDLVKKATCITPNYYEAELLTGIPLTSAANVHAALNVLHSDLDVPHVAVSSAPLAYEELTGLGLQAPGGPDAKYLACLVSSRRGSKYAIVFPAFPESYEGVGDVFSALILSRLAEKLDTVQTPIVYAAELAIASLQAIIGRTRKHALSKVPDPAQLIAAPTDAHDKKVARLSALELRLVQSAEAIRNPTVTYKAQLLV